MSVKGAALVGYSLVVGALLLYSRTPVVMGLGVLLITMASVAVVTNAAREHHRSP